MRLEFNVLWFENQPDGIKTQIEEVEEYIQSDGFIPRINIEIDASNLDELIRSQGLYDEYDLVVVDYDLGNSEQNGDFVAQKVRLGFGFTDIIFYSGKTPADLRALINAKQIDGVYCATRGPQLVEKIISHIGQMVRRLSRLEGMRGLAMATVGKCDDELRSFLRHVYAAADDGRKELMVSELDKLVQSATSNAGKKYAELDSFDSRLHSRSVTSFHLQKFALNLLRKKDGYKDVRSLLSRYDPEVLERRNILGHVLEERTDAGWVLSSIRGTSITIQDFPELRRHMAGHLGNIRLLRQIFDREGIK